MFDKLIMYNIKLTFIAACSVADKSQSWRQNMRRTRKERKKRQQNSDRYAVN